MIDWQFFKLLSGIIKSVRHFILQEAMVHYREVLKTIIPVFLTIQQSV